MGWFSRVFRRSESRGTYGASLSSKNTIIAQVVATHIAWYPLHNEGKEPPRGKAEAWVEKLQASGLDESELILLVADHKSRNTLL